MYPKDVVRFTAWAKAMVAGATVDKPNYGKTRSGSGTTRKASRARRRSRRRRFKRRKNNAD